MMKRYTLLLLFPFFALHANHFDVIYPILDLYDRPISILVLGDSEELLSQISHSYPVTCVVASRNEIKSEVIHLQKKLSLEDLKDLNKREHFDFIFAMNTLHEIEGWHSALHELFKLGDHLIVEVTAQDQNNPAALGISHYLTNLGLTTHLQASDSNQLFWLCFKPKSVHKALYSDAREQGISLLTFINHDGVTPSLDWVHQEKKKIPFWKRFVTRNIRLDSQTLY